MRVTNHIYVLSGGHYSAIGGGDALGEIYGVETPEGMILIDCGAPETGLAIARETLDYYGIKAPITHLILTHAHWDHAGCAAELQREGAKVIAGAGDEFACENGGNKNLASPFNDNHVFPAFKPDLTVAQDGELSLNGLLFHIITIPGHTPGSIAVYLEIDGKTALFTGDALQPDGRTLIENVALGWQGDINFSRSNIVASMMKLMELEVDMILPGHGKICLRGGTNLLRLAARTAFLTMR